MSDTEHLKSLLRERYQAWHDTRGGSVDRWMEIMDDNVCFGSLAEGADGADFTARCVGSEQLKGYFEGLLGDWEMIHFTVDHYIGDGDRIVAVGSTEWKNRKTGKTVDTPKADVWRFENGRAVEFYEFYDTAKIVAAAT